MTNVLLFLVQVWCDRQVAWSPQGTYLATYHLQGIKLWGSTLFEPQGRMIHTNVNNMEFSPCENYLVSYSSDAAVKDDNIIVWNVRTNTVLRTFAWKNPLDAKYQVECKIVDEVKGKKVERTFRGRVASYNQRNGTFSVFEGGSSTPTENIPADCVVALQNPNLMKWSPDGKFLARLGCDAISIYSLPDMTLLDKKSLAAKDLLDFAWSPKPRKDGGNMIAYWSPAYGNFPALISIVGVPDRKEICSRKLFDILDGRMVWQNEGDYLCVYMTKLHAKKRSYISMFFRFREASVPVEMLELPEPVVNMTWEPSGDRFAVVYGGDAGRSPSIGFYTMMPTASTAATTSFAAAAGSKNKGASKELALLYTKTGSPCTDVIWSPAGGVVALAHMISLDSTAAISGASTSSFELFDVESLVVMATRRHDRANRLLWDPSGRMLASCTITSMRATNQRPSPDDGYHLWTFQGTPICNVKCERLYRFLWRPRPAGLLSQAEKKAIVKNLRKYEKNFDKDDRSRRQELHQQVAAKRFTMAESFLELVNRRRIQNEAKYPAGGKWLVDLRRGFDENDDSNYEIYVQVCDMCVMYLLLTLLCRCVILVVMFFVSLCVFTERGNHFEFERTYHKLDGAQMCLNFGILHQNLSSI